MFLEKAWAKVNGGYSNIDAGLTEEALRDMTGASVEYVLVEDKTPEEIWKQLVDAEQNRYIMTAGSNDLNQDGTDDFVDDIGLAGSHAYSLIDVHEIKRTYNGYQKVQSTGDYSTDVIRLV